MLRIICLFLLVTLTSFTLGDGFKDRFIALYRAGKTAEAEQVLKEWEKVQPNDPELYIIRFNLLLSEAEKLRKSSGADGLHVGYEQELSIEKMKEELKRSEAQKASAIALMQQATEVLRKGIAIAPDRLDMRFGLAKTYEEWDKPVAQVQVLREALSDHAKTERLWLWRDGQPLPKPENQFIPHTLEGYANYYWATKEKVFPYDMRERDEATAKEYGRQLAELIRAYYPESSLGPFNLSIYYIIKERWAEAAQQLKKADALQPDDPITVLHLTNIAIKRKQKAEAATYLARLQKMPDMKKQAAECEAELSQLP